MKKIITILFLLVAVQINAQNTIEWDGIYQLQLSDFQSVATQIGNVKINSIHTASSLDFAFQMSNVEFMFTKNFNSKVSCIFKRDAASIIATDSSTANYLVNFAQYEFDLSELYARKLRKEIYMQKGTFSDVSFLQVIYNTIEKQYTDEHATASKITDLGQNEKKLLEIRADILKRIQEYPDFCKSCKPPKKKS
ncbi:hypothetical protein [Flavobacterium xinjiangense]|uniref:DUF4468 domain-containing protein n=1 Tax=Flavobacterium xinjiangense TaxID=178356 RepID=A0A1M7P2L2_9FLAO|nr:hypothetical protein [Flavobacterium xinjiangense]SHN10767.1 hypothetical protein SAMN05216269_11369 [Flavobacterium xinjiangense]